MSQTKEKMIIIFNEFGQPTHCGEVMWEAGSNPSGTKKCQKYKCKVCLRTWTDVNKPYSKIKTNA
jgi:hypothetical protein